MRRSSDSTPCWGGDVTPDGTIGYLTVLTVLGRDRASDGLRGRRGIMSGGSKVTRDDSFGKGRLVGWHPRAAAAQRRGARVRRRGELIRRATVIL